MPIFVPSIVTVAALIIWVQLPSGGTGMIGPHDKTGNLSRGELTIDDTLSIKGRAVTLTVERQRGLDVQSFQDTVMVRKEDSLGVTLTLSEPATLSVALQDLNSGQWVRLATNKAFLAGRTQVLKDTSQQVTDEQTRGRIVVGSPSDVESVIGGKKPSKPIVEVSIIPERAP